MGRSGREKAVSFFGERCRPAVQPWRSAYREKENMKTKSIPKHIKSKVLEIIDRFNRDVLADDYRTYIARFKGNYLFLDRDDGGYKPGPICRLRYTGDMTKWVFAIYRYSTSRYHPDECFFPGEDWVDGTIEGAMKAGLEAYQ